MRKERTIDTNDKVGTSIGRRQISVTYNVDLPILTALTDLRGIVDKKLAVSIESKMQNCAERGLGGERPLSAYFTFFPKNGENPEDTLLIEWGRIGDNQSAKLHDYLNNHINHGARLRDGATILSGHIGRIFISSLERFYNVALLDTLRSGHLVTSNLKEFPIVTTLLEEGIIPITSDGYPVKLVL